MNDNPFADFSMLTFDCYGTLIDWESGIWRALQPLLRANAEPGAADENDTRARMLAAFARHESAVQSESPSMPYPDVLAQTHMRIAAERKFRASAEMRETFGNSVGDWPAFEDSAEALRILKNKFHLGILSNVHRAGFAASARKLGVEFDEIFTAEEIGAYKPDPKNFQYMLAELSKRRGLLPGAVLHAAQSIFHDIKPGREAGLSLVWIDRQNLSGGGDWGATAKVEDAPRPDWTFPDLLSFARMSNAKAE
ncbi:MAG: HAD-IA family hydrolase [Gammaproteobacteria bacterium]